MRKYAGGLAAVSALMATSLSAQGTETQLARLRNLHLPESPGSVPVIYSPPAKERALRYQAELQNAHTWFEEQLRIQVPMLLAVLDREEYQSLGGRWALPYCHQLSNPGIVFLPSHLEELVGPEPEAKTPGEYVTYHEAGHIFADRLKIEGGNPFVDELVANVFMAGYIRENRRDLEWVLEGPSADHFERTPRYTSLADLDYVYTDVGLENYVWFQYHLQRVAKFLLAGQEFPAVIKALQKEFPAAAKQETLDRIIAHLDRIRPGVRETLGTLAGPTTLPRLAPSACMQPASGGAQSTIGVRNDTASPLLLVRLQGGTETVAPRSWSGFRMKAGEWLKLPDGTCLVPGDKPALAVIEKQ
ncbi:MAG: hypothetical protein ABSB35_27205 [Bryobacteraceae bacterium]